MSPPSLRLWELLLATGTPEEVEYNLKEGDEDFQKLDGPTASCFIEWVYTMREKRELVTRLCAVLRPSDARTIALKAGFKKNDLKEPDPERMYHKVLEKIGIPEPRPAPPLVDGVEQIVALKRSLEGWFSGDEVEPPVAPARRGAERLLKIIVRFLWSSGYSDILLDVARDGLHDFRPVDVTSETWLDDLDLGTSTYLLRAFELERIERERPLPFVAADVLWDNPAFQRFVSFAGAVTNEVHDSGVSEDARRELQLKCATQVCDLIESGALPVPRTVRFFRRYDDGPIVHLEGYAFDDDGRPECLQFYEVDQDIELNKVYMFMAPTNPKPVHASIVDLYPAFMNPV